MDGTTDKENAVVNDPANLIELLPRALPVPRTSSPRPWVRRLIWLVPALAVAIVAWLAVSSLRTRGPTVRITFATAEGLEPHKTTIKYKSVNIGVVRSIDLLDDRSGVVVTAQLSRQAQDLLVDDTRFWVVRPRVSLTGVSGIGTLISGAHIGVDAGKLQAPRSDFVGLEAPPWTVSDRPGRGFTLRAENVGSVDVGSPIYLRRVQVGQVTSVALDPRGGAVLVQIFVDAPHHLHVTADTRFWNASGVDLTLNSNGIQLDTQSLASMVAGGIAFQTPADAPEAAPALAGTRFELFAGRQLAMRQPGLAANNYRLVFTHPVAGLSAGAPVELAGLEIGQVLRVRVDFDGRSGAARTTVDVGIHPERVHLYSDGEAGGGQVLGPMESGGDGEWRVVIARLVARGVRARVRTANLLTGQRAVAFERVPGAARATIDWNAQPVVLPTADGDPGDVPAAVGRLVAKLEKVPIEALAREGALTMAQMRDTLETTSRLVNRVDTQLAPRMGAMMAQAQKTLDAVEQTLSAEAPLQQDLRGALHDMSEAGQAVRSVAEYLERHPESLIRGKRED